MATTKPFATPTFNNYGHDGFVQLGAADMAKEQIVEIFPPPGHTGVWCSGNTPSSVLCNEESCGSIPSVSDSFYENSNMADALIRLQAHR